MSRFNLPEIEFFEKAPEQILQEMLFYINEKTGLEFQRGDPRLKFAEALATFVSIERNRADHQFKQNLLAYAVDDMLDQKGVEFDSERLNATPAKTTIQFNLEEERVSALIIEAGTRVAVADVYFVTQETIVIPVGVNTATIDFVCEEDGEHGNGFLPGEISTLVNPLPYVKSISNITESAGGTDVEDDDSYAERIRLAPQKFSVAGPALAYKYWAYTASQDIGDVEVLSPEPGLIEIYVLLKNGQLPTIEHLNKVTEICSDESVRPLTDQVLAVEPTIVEYDVSVQYWISDSDITLASTREEQITQAFNDYLLWQRSKLGRHINPSELISQLRQAGATKIEITGLTYTELEKTEIAQEQTVSIAFMGLSNEQ